MVIEPVIELHLPWKYSSALLHYLLFHSPCEILLKKVGSTSQSMRAIPSSCHFIFRLLPGWFPSQSTGKSPGSLTSPCCPHCGLPILLYPPPSASSFCCLCSEGCCGAGSQQGSGERSAGWWCSPNIFHFGYCLRIWWVLRWMQATSLICVYRATKLLLYRLLQLNSRRVKAKQAMNCSCWAEGMAASIIQQGCLSAQAVLPAEG